MEAGGEGGEAGASKGSKVVGYKLIVDLPDNVTGMDDLDVEVSSYKVPCLGVCVCVLVLYVYVCERACVRCYSSRPVGLCIWLCLYGGTGSAVCAVSVSVCFYQGRCVSVCFWQGRCVSVWCCQAVFG